MKLVTMQLKQNHIKQLRELKAWSQSHLAEISDLSLRTIQRIEKEHKASKESVKALASVFETTPEEFLISQKSLKGNKALWLTVALAALLVFCTAYWWPISSTSVTLDISASMKQLDQPISTSVLPIADVDKLEQLYTVDLSVILKEKEKTTVKLNDRISYEITPFFIEGDKILLTTSIIDKEQSSKPAIATPKVITNNHVEAFIVANNEDTGAVYEIGITPHR